MLTASVDDTEVARRPVTVLRIALDPASATLLNDAPAVHTLTTTPPTPDLDIALRFFRTTLKDKRIRAAAETFYSVYAVPLKGAAIRTNEKGIVPLRMKAGFGGQGAVAAQAEVVYPEGGPGAVAQAHFYLSNERVCCDCCPSVELDDQDAGMSPAGSFIALYAGEMKIHTTDLVIPGRGFGWAFSRSYRSQPSHLRPAATGDFAIDWAFNYSDDRLIQDGQNIIKFSGELRTDVFIARDGSSLDYDDNGNQIEEERFVFEWDYRNRLRVITRKDDGALIAVYAYDAINRRLRKRVTNSGVLSGTTAFYYDGWQAIEERNAADTLVQQYVYGPYIDESLVLDRNFDGDVTGTRAADQRLFYHQDKLYSVYAITNILGNLVEGYQFEPFGRATFFKPGLNGAIDFGSDDAPVHGISSAFANPYLWSGRRLDAESQLWYFRTRYYDDELGRFLSRDPTGYGDGMGLYNAYFVPNGLDPSGRIIVTNCPIDKYLEDNDVTGYRVYKPPFKDYTYESTALYNKKNLDSEILGTMINSGRTFRIKGAAQEEELKNLELHLQARQGVIDAAKRARFGFTGGNPKLNPEYWAPQGFGPGQRPQIQPGKMWGRAIWDPWNNPEKYELGCAAATVFCLLAGAQSAIDWEDEVAKLMEAGGSGVFHHQPKTALDDWVPGDAGFIKNTAAGPIAPSQLGENIIYIGNDKYWGHGPWRPDMSIRTLGAWIKQVEEWGGARLTDRRDYPSAGLD